MLLNKCDKGEIKTVTFLWVLKIDQAFVVKFCFIHKISQNYIHLRCLLDIKVLTQQAKAAGALIAYCSGESSVDGWIL